MELRLRRRLCMRSGLRHQRPHVQRNYGVAIHGADHVAHVFPQQLAVSCARCFPHGSEHTRPITRYITRSRAHTNRSVDLALLIIVLPVDTILNTAVSSYACVISPTRGIFSQANDTRCRTNRFRSDRRPPFFHSDIASLLRAYVFLHDGDTGAVTSFYCPADIVSNGAHARRAPTQPHAGGTRPCDSGSCGGGHRAAYPVGSGGGGHRASPAHPPPQQWPQP